jgi:immune inhibitor A
MLRKIAATITILVLISLLVGPLVNFSGAAAPAAVEREQAALGNSAARVASSSGAGARPVDNFVSTGKATNVADKAKAGAAVKPLDEPNPQDKARMMARQRMLEAGQTAEAAALAQTGTDRVLVVLAEFAGTDVFTWTAPITPSNPATGSQWDPLGISDPDEDTGTVGDCSNIITQTQTFTYTGPLHNQIARPLSAADRSGDAIWSPDFNKQWFTDFMFGNGVNISYTRQDSSNVFESFIGQSVKQYFSDLSTGTYTATGDVIGWVSVPHSTWYYGADACPGARAYGSSSLADKGIPGAGTPRTLVHDALDSVNAISNTIPGFNWANYDLTGDGIIDRLWIVHAGYGEEDSTTLLDRDPVVQGTGVTPDPAAFYGESAIWSHSSGGGTPYSVTQSIAAGAYIIMPENGGIGVFAHEYAHNLGADDLYAYGNGETSTGFWALQADDWTGYPIGFEPPAPDPWHLDNWGWLDPKIITDTAQVYTVTLGQASYFNTNSASGQVYRGAKIELPDQIVTLPVPVWQGSNYWWGGKLNSSNAAMTTKIPVALPSGSITLTFDTAYGIEANPDGSGWDFLWVQVSTNAGTTWNTLTNTNTTCTHDPQWVGGSYGFPTDLCGAGLGGFTDYNANFPDPNTETFNLSAYAGQSVLLRFWYMTDSGTTYEGPFVDDVAITSGSGTVFTDNAESGDGKWDYDAPWNRITDGKIYPSHNYYLQWRNTNANGGYDSALGDSRWRYGPANTGLLVWYNNNAYTDNEIYNYLEEGPSFGPKGRMLVVDSHPDPYRDPNNAFPNAIADLPSRSQMRDATFTLQPTVGFTFTAANGIVTDTHFAGRPAVSEFNDALGYYPGIEYALRGPSPCANKYWFDKMWDASAVVPARNMYSTKATGASYAGQGIRMRGFASPASQCGSAWYGFWYPPFVDATNSGNPGDVGGQYGWHVQLIEEAADHTWAKVRIWNGAVVQTPTYTPHAITAAGTKTFTYTYRLENASSVTSTVAVTFTLDSHLTSSSPLTYPALALSAGQVTTLTVVATGTVPSTMTSATWTTKVELNDGFSPTVWTNLLPTTIKFYNVYLPTIRR